MVRVVVAFGGAGDPSVGRRTEIDDAQLASRASPRQSVGEIARVRFPGTVGQASCPAAIRSKSDRSADTGSRKSDVRFPRVRHRLLIAAAGLAAAGLLTGCARGSVTAGARQPSLQKLLDGAGQDLPFNPQLAAISCPYERGPVKEGSDADRFRVSTTVTHVSVFYLRTRPKPSTYPRDRRVTAAELHTYQVTAYLTQYKEESDGDVHLVLKDAAGRSMIAEMPYRPCVPSTSRWRSAIASARYSFTQQYRLTTSWHYVHRLVDVRGIGFMDVRHGQTGVAPNGVELHPVIYFHLH